MRVLLLSGISGSGKSFRAATDESRDDYVVRICSADDYFICEGGYVFDPTKLGEAHAACMRKYIETLTHRLNRTGVLIVDNTNTTALELAPYVLVANAFGITPTIRTIWCDPIVAHARNKHNVPLGTIMSTIRQSPGENHSAVLECSSHRVGFPSHKG